MFYCLVAGSRGFNDYNRMKQELDAFLPKYGEITIVSGGARGADTLAERYAKERGCLLVVIKADWDKFGKSAGYRRNEAMHDYIKQFENRACVCFWDGTSKGTQHNFGLAEKNHTQLLICKYNSEGE